MYKIQITDTESNWNATVSAELAAITVMNNCDLQTITINRDGYAVVDAIIKHEQEGV